MAKYLFFKLSDSRPRNVANFGLFLRKVDYDVLNPANCVFFKY